MKYEFVCLPGCSWCCSGHVHLPREVIEKHRDKIQREILVELEHPDRQTSQLITLDGSCVFEKNHKCTIYVDRPFVCRVFGLHEKQPCPFIRPDGTKRPAEEVAANLAKLDATIKFAKKVYNL